MIVAGGFAEDVDHPPKQRAGRIRLLPELTVNRIAAGEVIERPAAAVRELVENALDAGASRIEVVLAGGGIDRIEVADNGAGMAPDELALCIQRHATSKLADDDLVNIATLGFRGEALPSIGAAGRLAITTRQPGADSAFALSVEGGHLTPVAPTAGAPGTRVVVRDLFFATPARRKFLRTPRAEGEAAAAAVRRLAFAAPQVAFRLEVDGRTDFDLPAQSHAARVAALLGPEAAGALLEVDFTAGALAVTGYAAAPSFTRANALGQTLIVNGRPVVDPLLRTAVRVAYRDVIAMGRHPVVVLYLAVPAESVDVNVHPAKAEVRFREADAVRGLVIRGLSRALSGGAGPAVAPAGMRPQYVQRPSVSLRPPAPPPTGLREFALPFDATPSARTLPAEPFHGPFPKTGDDFPSSNFPLGAPVAQVLDTYVIAVAADGSLVLVDQHAAHERLTHEELRGQIEAGAVRSQPLLLPGVVDLAPDDVARLLARAPELARFGLEIEPFGPGAVLVRALPAVLGAPDPAALLRDLADEFAEMDEATSLTARLDAVVARLACHGSIRAGRRLSGPEMDALLRRMEATPRAATCSHGRPTFLKLSKAEIERMFGRR
jgi:DNA mismatch repair protein MutL